ncbi:terminase large subunit [Bacillus amyloliquefaciens]|uniref:terminase large subunit n=1 Tax=Bacillus amyloliquefaciens TaxID=1390 RepID=UPI0011CA1011|nr:terminase TerL endonuclease subunit [Bacillus amyloliquefaciens]TXK24604.1 terminase large subunit [Bacillus amyloliquefaciens]
MIDYATLYAKQVTDGEIIACKKVKQACERHLNDLQRSKSDDFPYEYTPQKTEKVIKFLEMLPDVSTGKPTKLALFQKFIVGSLYGWRDKETGYRRFTKAYISMARKGGKSILVAGIALYELLFGEAPKFDRQIYATANSREQAGTVFEKMIKAQLNKIREQSPSIRKITKVKNNEILHTSSNSLIKALSRDTKNHDSLNVLIGILDEYHTASNTQMMEVLESSQGQQDQGLIIIISTAGFQLNGPMYSIEYPYVTDILSGRKENDNYFAIVYEMDDEEEVSDESLWIKSNPLLGVDSISRKFYKYLRRKLKEAQDKNDINPTLVKNFNIWKSASSESLINGEDWKRCAVEEPPDIRGKEVYVGIDMSRVDDLTAVSWIYPLNDKEERYFIDSHSFVGTKYGLDNKIQRDKIDYRKLAEEGFCTITDKKSGTINQKQIIEYIQNHVNENDLIVKAILFDPHNIQLLLNELEDFTQIEVGQKATQLSRPTKNFQYLVYDKKMLHANNPLLTIAVNNALTVHINDLIRIDKDKNREKIDPIAAAITAHYEAMHHYTDNVDQDYYANYNFAL